MPVHLGHQGPGMSMFVFGYGSLVNTRTHRYSDPVPVTLSGWKRCWVATAERELAFLSVAPDPNAKVAGLAASVPAEDWADLDVRERAYDRHDALALVTPSVASAKSLSVYAVPQDRHLPSRNGHPILLSYVDVVVQGYLDHFGEAGVADFFDNTAGWDAPIRNDRANPVYSRHQRLDPGQTALVDHHLARLAAVME